MNRTLPELSVVIPTFNRRLRLSELLGSLAGQALPGDRFEVIVVDDGSTDDTSDLAGSEFPYSFHYLFQTNQGDAAARNFGAEHARGDYLLFLDDDILLDPDYLQRVLNTLDAGPDRIVVGRDIPWLSDANPLDDRSRSGVETLPQTAVETIPFVDVCSNNMGIRREAYLLIGPMENLGFSGSSIWCDVEFAYRSFLQGHTFLRDNHALCWHRDHILESFERKIKRAWDSGFRAAALFNKHPALMGFLPMFTDKTPLDLRHDSPGIVLRKLLRRVSASPLSAGLIEAAVRFLPGGLRGTRLNRALHRWLIGSAIFQGYTAGRREMGTFRTSGG